MVITKTIPVFFVLFGNYRTFTLPQQVDFIPDSFVLGGDILKEAIDINLFPRWVNSDIGSARVANLGTVKMKRVDCSHWCPNTFQTCLWIGTAIPSRRSQERCSESSKRGKGSETKGRGKGEHRAKGKNPS